MTDNCGGFAYLSFQDGPFWQVGRIPATWGEGSWAFRHDQFIASLFKKKLSPIWQVSRLRHAERTHRSVGCWWVGSNCHGKTLHQLHTFLYRKNCSKMSHFLRLLFGDPTNSPGGALLQAVLRGDLESLKKESGAKVLKFQHVGRSTMRDATKTHILYAAQRWKNLMSWSWFETWCTMTWKTYQTILPLWIVHSYFFSIW